MMKKILGTLLVGAVAVVAASSVGHTPAAAAPKGADAGKAVFLEYKCNKCHTVASAGIKVLKAKKGREPADLSSVGAKHSRKWIGKYIKKEEKMDGRKHKKKFAGEPAEETALLDWLSSLKAAKK